MRVKEKTFTVAIITIFFAAMGYFSDNALAADDPPVFNNCASTLSLQSQNYIWSMPIINYSPAGSQQAHYSANLTYIPTTDNNMWFKLNNASTVNDITPFAQCSNTTAATLSQNSQGNLIITVPEVVVNDLGYSAQIQYVPNAQTKQTSDYIKKGTNSAVFFWVTEAALEPINVSHGCCGVTHYTGYSRVQVCAIMKNMKAGDRNQNVELLLRDININESNYIAAETGSYSYTYNKDRSVVKKICATFLIDHYGRYDGEIIVRDSTGKIVASGIVSSINVTSAPQDCLWN